MQQDVTTATVARSHLRFDGGADRRRREGMSATRTEAQGARTIGARIVFCDLSVRMRDTGATVLENVSGELPSASISAVLGPSGAGKTFFLTALADRLGGNALVSGSVTVVTANGRYPVHSMRRVLGFAPQTDVMHHALTVEENIAFSVRMRLRERTRGEHLRLVEQCIRTLGLENVRGLTVGSDRKRGISGGQKRRTNIAMELVCDPAILFLDVRIFMSLSCVCCLHLRVCDFCRDGAQVHCSAPIDASCARLTRGTL